MPVDPCVIRDAFLGAAELPPADRPQYLIDRCGGDDALRAAVERLLAAHESPARILETSATVAGERSLAATDPAVTETFGENDHRDLERTTSSTSAEMLATVPSERPSGSIVGQVIAERYKLREVLGEGGMGTVYRAEQTEPVKRQVALKVIRIGMDSRTVLARFNAERQALALMDHPNIARVFDGGTTDAGQPFFVMELVQGVPITAYCDSKRLSVQARLELFVAVCQAVQHAHQKGIIHRDIKPSNVLVTEVDNRPAPKVIDFGVAKAMEFNLTDQSLGDTGAIVGTPTYMSPEQADPASMDIDTRTDIYALGVILYELLAGSPPIDPSQFRRGALLEMLRMVREVEPPRPSTKVSSSDALPNIAATRGVEPAQLKRSISGDLDWIVMKALEKDRTRRYETANGFAADILRHLSSEPVLAVPPSRAYRLRKFVRKHRGGVIATSLLLVTLLLGIAGTTWGWYASARSAEAERVAKLAAQKQQARAEDRETQAIDAVKRFRDAVINEPVLRSNPDLDALRRRLLKEPLVFFKSLRDRLQGDKDTRPESLARLAQASYDLGSLTMDMGAKQDALLALREALAIFQKLAGVNPAVTDYQKYVAYCHNSIGIVLRDTGQPAESLKANRQSLAISQKLAEMNPGAVEFQKNLAFAHNNVGVALATAGRRVEAMNAFDKALAIRQKLADSYPAVTELQSDLATGYFNNGMMLIEVGKTAEAMKAYESALALFQKVVRAEPTVAEHQFKLASTQVNMGTLFSMLGNNAEALASLKSADVIMARVADANPAVFKFRSGVATTRHLIGSLLNASGNLAEGLKLLQSALQVREKLAELNPTVAERQEQVAESHNNIGLVLRGMNKPGEAMLAYERGLAIRRQLTREHPESADYASELGAILNNMAVLDLEARRFHEARVRLREAVVSQRKALAVHPAHPRYRQFLQNHLICLSGAAQGLGDSAGVAEAGRELAALRDSDPAIVALDSRLAAILKGAEKPKDTADRLALAQRTYEKALYASAARLWAEALASNPELGNDRQAQHRYNAACTAALAGCGRSKDDPPPNEAAKTKLRQKALEWLNAELAAWTKIFESDAANARPLVTRTLTHWQADSELAGVRDEKDLARLPQPERAAFKQLWSDVERLLNKTRGDKG